MITALAWRNIWRQPIRTTLSILGMALTSMLLVFMLSFQFGSYDTMKSSMLQISDGFGQFQPAGYSDDPEISKTIANPDGLIAELSQIDGIDAVTARSNGFVLLAKDERSFAAAIVGVDPANEGKISTLSNLISEGRSLTPDDTNAVIIGDGLARNLKLSVGDTVTMLGSGMDGSVAADVLNIVGIFKTNVPELDRQIAQMPLSRFDDAFLMEGGVNIVAISGDALLDIERIEPRLRDLAEKYGVSYLNWAELRPEVQQMISLDMATSSLMYVTLIVVVVFIILNTLYMSVLERTREFGVLLALGMKPKQIGRMVWTEFVCLSLLGNGIGLLLGLALTGYVQSIGITVAGMDEIYAQWGLPSTFYPVMTPLRVVMGPLAIVAGISALGIIPYRRVLGLQPVKAMAA